MFKNIDNITDICTSSNEEVAIRSLQYCKKTLANNYNEF